MWHLLTLYLAFAMLSLTGALSPGPLMTMAISEGARSGRWAGTRLALGHGIVELPLAFAIAYGLGTWLHSPAVRAGIALVGAGVLGWMGYGLVSGAWQGRLRMQDAAPEAQPAAQAMALRFGHVPGGILLTVANPYWSFWWATVGAGRITDVATLGLGPLAIGGLVVVHWLTDLGWLGGLSYVTASGRGLIGDRVYRGVLLICGLFLLAFAIYLAWDGSHILRSGL